MSKITKDKIVPVILSGGMGSRLWPLSRKSYPKQFLDLNVKGFSLVRETIDRVNDDNIFYDPIIICNEAHRFVIEDQLREVGVNNATIILEPCGRNTASALAVVATYLHHFNDKNIQMLVLPSDHIIRDVDVFLASVKKAKKLSSKGNLVTFGITPTKPEIGFGYIKYGTEASKGIFEVKKFVEKPEFKDAEKYVASGEYVWNAGIFMFTSHAYLEELNKFMPEISALSENIIETCEQEENVVILSKELFSSLPDQSIDYAVMEKTDKAFVVPMECGWSDAGSWEALWEIKDKDEHCNVCLGNSFNIDTTNSMISCEDGPKVATLGLDNIIVVSTKDSVLVVDKNRTQDIKQLVKKIEETDENLISNYRQVYRPWGYYDSIAQGNRYQVKCITVKPSGKLSLQMHYHRAEHWIVVKGTALVTCGDKEELLTENQSVYIPSGTVHRIENPGKMELQIIEVQSGAYLGEDDIVRYEDTYGRAK